MLCRRVPVRVQSSGDLNDYSLLQSVLVKTTMQCGVTMTHHKYMSDERCGNGEAAAS